LYENVN